MSLKPHFIRWLSRSRARLAIKNQQMPNNDNSSLRSSKQISQDSDSDSSTQSLPVSSPKSSTRPMKHRSSLKAWEGLQIDRMKKLGSFSGLRRLSSGSIPSLERLSFSKSSESFEFDESVKRSSILSTESSSSDTNPYSTHCRGIVFDNARNTLYSLVSSENGQVRFRNQKVITNENQDRYRLISFNSEPLIQNLHEKSFVISQR